MAPHDDEKLELRSDIGVRPPMLWLHSRGENKPIVTLASVFDELSGGVTSVDLVPLIGRSDIKIRRFVLLLADDDPGTQEGGAACRLESSELDVLWQRTPQQWAERAAICRNLLRPEATYDFLEFGQKPARAMIKID
ncbi:MAG TPA: hypothetical protein VG797_06335 [Phycisphaerales bacterium]|nr:hypothetical protein [Phycisphaerales bacterium]